jgi:adenylate kinase family enzyme
VATVRVRKVTIVASASGNGKTTFGRRLAQRLAVPFVELDALVHGPGWIETADDVLRAELEPVLVRDGWVIDGVYERKLGKLVLEAAELIVWLDLPIRVWLPRLVRRTWKRLARREELWNGNRESLRGVLVGRDSLFAYALRSHFRRRREWPASLAGLPVVRLRSVHDVDRFLAAVGRSPATGEASGGGATVSP